MARYTDPVFAPIDRDHTVERLAGGNETEVYRSDDGRHVVKLKADRSSSQETALAAAQQQRADAQRFAACLGPRYSIASQYALTGDAAGHARILVIQPFIAKAVSLYALDYHALNAQQRAQIAAQLRDIIDLSLRFYRKTHTMPDLYGRSSSSSAERERNRRLDRLPQRLWSFLVERNLLRSHNLMYTNDGQVILVDYDAVQRSQLYRTVYFGVRWMLFWRDHVLIDWMRKGGSIPGA